MKHTLTTKTAIFATALAIGLSMGTPCKAMKRRFEHDAEKNSKNKGTVELSGYQKSNQKKLFDAAKNGNYGMVLHLLDLGVDPNIQDEYQKTPLFYARKNGYTDIVEALTAEGAKAKTYIEDLPSDAYLEILKNSIRTSLPQEFIESIKEAAKKSTTNKQFRNAYKKLLQYGLKDIIKDLPQKDNLYGKA